MTEEADDDALDRWRVDWKHRFDWQRLLNISEVVRVFVSRCRFLWSLSRFYGNTELSITSSAPEDVTTSPDFRRTTWKGCCLVLDVALGMCLVSLIMQDGGTHCSNLLGSCLHILRSGVFNLTGVIDWLMNNPAGLKLNKELAHTLGAFFKHHISLWQMYIVYLTSFLEGHDSLLCSFGLLGVSFHAALIADCISLFTVHVHCFYIYMARLFNIQLRGLVSLGRFFRGKKWNPLRERVDHVSSSVDQLFVGSLIMMVFVFLLPTIMTFYFVFASLHVVVRALQHPFRIASRWMEILIDERNLAQRSSPDPTTVPSSTESSTSSLLVSSCWKLFSGEVM